MSDLEENLVLNVAKIVQLASADPNDSARGFLKSLDKCKDLALPIIDVVRRHDTAEADFKRDTRCVGAEAGAGSADVVPKDQSWDG